MSNEQQICTPPSMGPFIGITVQPDGRLGIRMWQDGKINAVYAYCSVEQALRRQLPQALAEAFAMAQPASGSSVTV